MFPTCLRYRGKVFTEPLTSNDMGLPGVGGGYTDGKAISLMTTVLVKVPTMTKTRR
jgi:hypothetical protein